MVNELGILLLRRRPDAPPVTPASIGTRQAQIEDEGVFHAKTTPER